MEQVRHQMPAQAGRGEVANGEAGRRAASDETGCTRTETEDTGPSLLEQALARENMRRAWKQVKANQGAAGVDGMDINQTGRYLQNAW